MARKATITGARPRHPAAQPHPGPQQRYFGSDDRPEMQPGYAASPQPGYACEAMCRPAPQVGEQVREAIGSVEALDELARKIVDRLQNVLSPQVPRTAAPPLPGPMPLVPLADQVRQVRFKVEDVRDVLADLLDRLQL